MSTVIDSLERAQLRRVPRFAAGDRVKVHFQVIEGTRRRTQVFEGVVIKRQGEGVRETFTAAATKRRGGGRCGPLSPPTPPCGWGVGRPFPAPSPKTVRFGRPSRG